MNYYCELCDKTMKNKSKNNHFKSITHNKFAKYIQIIYSIDNPNFFDVDDIYNKFINVNNKKYHSYLMKCKFNLVFDNNFSTCIETYLDSKSLTIFYWKKFLIIAILDFINQGYKFSHIANMNIITFNLKRNMTYKNYLNQPMSAVERRLCLNIARNPHLINSLNRFVNHPLIRIYSHIPFNN